MLVPKGDPSMTRKQIGVVGCHGYVGRAMVNFFEHKYEVLTCDTDAGTLDIEELDGCDLVVLCLPTPSRTGCSCDTRYVEEAVDKSNAKMIVIKSTIPPGTTDRLAKEKNKRLVFCPEYIGEGGYFDPHGFSTTVIATPWFIFGGANGNKEWASEVADLYAPIGGPSKKYLITDAKTAELVKYWNNCYFAMKVSFANEMRAVCEAFEVNFHEARELWAQDPRNDSMHSLAFRDSPGFGGKCLPKDLSAFIRASRDAGHAPHLLEALEGFNEAIRSE